MQKGANKKRDTVFNKRLQGTYIGYGLPMELKQVTNEDTRYEFNEKQLSFFDTATLFCRYFLSDKHLQTLILSLIIKRRLPLCSQTFRGQVSYQFLASFFLNRRDASVMLGCECEMFGTHPYTHLHLLITLVAVAPLKKKKKKKKAATCNKVHFFSVCKSVKTKKKRCLYSASIAWKINLVGSISFQGQGGRENTSVCVQKERERL